MKSTTKQFVFKYLQALDCPRALTVWLLFVNNEHDQLVELECNPSHYIDKYRFRDDYTATSFLSKSSFLKTSFNLKDRALEKFYAAEEQCRKKNLDLSDPLYFYKMGCEALIFRASQKIHSILGDFSVDEWFEACEFGPGVSQKIKRDVSRARKFQSETDITTALHNVIGGIHHLAYENWPVAFTIQDSNSIVTVPKNSKTDRTIAIEPGINLWYQKGIGSMIRRRLLRVGIDLNEKGKLRKRNQLLCQLASKTGHLATVDFSAASDTISRRLVETLIGGDWYHALSSARSMLGCVHNHSIVYQKFSSMGNGFTFELETLIFYALAFAVCEEAHIDTSSISVFGDDVIIPSEVYERFSEVSQICGFTVNNQKSFHNGYFRESCGDHWFDNLNCKPYFLKEEIREEIDVYKAANSVRRLAHRRNSYGCDIRLLRSWYFLRHRAVSLSSNGRLGCLISEGYGDGGLIVNFDESNAVVAKNGLEGYFSHHKVFVSKTVSHDTHGALLARIRDGSRDRSYGNNFDLRGQGRYKRMRILIRQWYDLGPWC